MDFKHFNEFMSFIDDELLPATEEIAKLDDDSRKHIQKLVYTNLVDRFDATLDETILALCRHPSMLEIAMKNLTQPITESALLNILMEAETIQEAIDEKLREALRGAVLKDRHSKKLACLLKALKPEGNYEKLPRVNTNTGDIYNRTKIQNKTTPHSICGYADWLYSRRNAVVHGGGATTFLVGDAKMIERLYGCRVGESFKIRISSVSNAANFYKALIRLVVEC